MLKEEVVELQVFSPFSPIQSLVLDNYSLATNQLLDMVR